MSPLHKVGMRIAEIRNRKKLSQEELAAKAGISRGYLARLETGRHDPTLSMLMKVAKALNVKVGRLLE